jgi:hypothetical protein
VAEVEVGLGAVVGDVDLIIVTLRPRASRMAASEAAAMPLPSEETTPPVTKTMGVWEAGEVMSAARRWKAAF